MGSLKELKEGNLGISLEKKISPLHFLGVLLDILMTSYLQKKNLATVIIPIGLSKAFMK